MPARPTSPRSPTPDSAKMLCGVTGTEFLTVTLGATPDMLEFVPAKPAWRIPPAADSQTDPAYFDTTATTSWGQLVAAEGTYISQPERAPLYNQKDATPALLAGAAPASGLTVHVLDYFPVVSWSAATQGSAPAVPIVPYAGLDFASNPNLDPASYRDMESRAINPKRADMFLTTAATMTAANAAKPAAAAAGHVAARHDAARACWPSSPAPRLPGPRCRWPRAAPASSSSAAMGPSICRAVQQNQIFTVITADPATKDPLDPAKALFDFSGDRLEIGDWTFDLSPGGLAAPDGTPPIFMMKFYPHETIEELVADTRLWSQPDTFNTTFTAAETQAYLQTVIADAKASVFPERRLEARQDLAVLEFLPDRHRSDVQRHPRRQLQHAARQAAAGDPGRPRRHEGSGHRRLPRPPCRRGDQQHRSDAADADAVAERDLRAGRLREDEGTRLRRGAAGRVDRLRLRGLLSARPVHQFRAAQLRLRGRPHHQQSVQDRGQSRYRPERRGESRRRGRQRHRHHRLLPGPRHQRRQHQFGTGRLFLRGAGQICLQLH